MNMELRSIGAKGRFRRAADGSGPARLLPPTPLGGPIPWVIAILIALVVVVAAGGLALRNLSDNTRSDLAGAVTVQIAEADSERRALLAERAGEALGSLEIVSSLRIVPEEELEEMLEPWLGAGASAEEVPIPALIDVELRGVASAERIAGLRSALDDALGSEAEKAGLDAQSDWLQPVYDTLKTLQYIALGLILLVGTATTAAVWLSARSAFADHRETVEIICLLGGTDTQVTRAFQWSVLRDAATGAAVGLVLGMAAVWLLAQQFAALDNGMTRSGGLGWTDWLLIALIPLGAIALALATARITISRALRALV